MGAALAIFRMIPGVFKLIPREVWYALAVAFALRLAIGWYHGQIHDAEKRGEDRAYARVEAKARDIEARANTITAKIRTLSDETNRRIDDSARSQLVRGPGKAACSGSLPAAPGGREQAGGPGDAPVARVSYPEWQQLIGLPFTSTVEFARLCDANRAEALSWREWQRANEALHSEGSAR